MWQCRRRSEQARPGGSCATRRLPLEHQIQRPRKERAITEVRNRGGSLDLATAWLRMTPQRLFSFAEVAWQGMADTS